MTTTPAPVGALDTGPWLRRLGRTWAERRAYRAMLAQLTELSDQQLHDIGMTRDALPAIARKAAHEI